MEVQQISRFHQKIAPLSGENIVPIVLASSEYFLPYACVAIHSLLLHGNNHWFYMLYLLNTGYSEAFVEKIEGVMEDYKNASLCLVDVSESIRNIKLSVHGHVKKETFYRLLIPEIFSGYSRVIYLDCDLVVNTDISKLMQINMEGALLAGVVDADVIGQYYQANSAMKMYCDKILALRDPLSYLQAGVIVFHISELRRIYPGGTLLRLARTAKLEYADQDLLNSVCQGRIIHLDMSWNVATNCGGYRISKIISKAPQQIYEAYMESRKEPYIVHYSGFEKPWDNPDSDMANYFWEYARQTSFYLELCERLQQQSTKCLFSKQIKQHVKSAVRFFLPDGTAKRQAVKKIYYRLFRHR